jgi:hypothetical protein
VVLKAASAALYWGGLGDGDVSGVAMGRRARKSAGANLGRQAANELEEELATMSEQAQGLEGREEREVDGGEDDAGAVRVTGEPKQTAEQREEHKESGIARHGRRRRISAVGHKGMRAVEARFRAQDGDCG